MEPGRSSLETRTFSLHYSPALSADIPAAPWLARVSALVCVRYRVGTFDLLFLCKPAFWEGAETKCYHFRWGGRKGNLRACTTSVLRLAGEANKEHGLTYADAGVTANENTKMNDWNVLNDRLKLFSSLWGVLFWLK